jgi:hypothetical protein
MTKLGICLDEEVSVCLGVKGALTNDTVGLVHRLAIVMLIRMYRWTVCEAQVTEGVVVGA